MRGRGSQHPYIGVGGPAAPRAAWEAGRPAAGRSVPKNLSAIFFPLFFAGKPLPPRSRAARYRPPGSVATGVYSYKFPNRKYIFVKNENIKYKNEKNAPFFCPHKMQQEIVLFTKKKGDTHGEEPRIVLPPSKQWSDVSCSLCPLYEATVRSYPRGTPTMSEVSSSPTRHNPLRSIRQQFGGLSNAG